MWLQVHALTPHDTLLETVFLWSKQCQPCYYPENIITCETQSTVELLLFTNYICVTSLNGGYAINVCRTSILYFIKPKVYDLVRGAAYYSIPTTILLYSILLLYPYYYTTILYPTPLLTPSSNYLGQKPCGMQGILYILSKCPFSRGGWISGFSSGSWEGIRISFSSRFKTISNLRKCWITDQWGEELNFTTLL